MSGAIIYLEREDRGDRIRSVRLLAERVDETWRPPESVGAAEAPQQAAAWVARTLKGRDLSGVLLCVDVNGAFAGWTSAPTSDRRAIETVLRRSEGDALAGVAGGEELSLAGAAMSASHSLAGPELAAPGGGSFQVLRQEQPGAGESQQAARASRAVALAMRDAPVRLMLDALDREGIETTGVTSLWQVMGLVWDAAGPLGREEGDSDRIVSTNRTPLGVVLVDPSGRLVWTWSEGGKLLAAGAALLPTHGERVALPRWALGRLSAEWVGWAAQLSGSPGRVAMVLPELDTAHGVDASSAGQELARAWPDATVDAARLDDPVGETLSRMLPYRADAVVDGEDPQRALTDLSGRPGRMHRRMYAWGAVALLSLAGLAGGGAWLLMGAAASARERASEYASQAVSLYQAQGLAEAASGSRIVMQLRAAVAAEREKLKTDIGAEPPPPVLAELDNLMFILPQFFERGLTIERIELVAGTLPRLVVRSPSLEVQSELRASFASFGGSRLNWSQSSVREIGSGEDRQLELTFVGTWQYEGGGS